MSRVYKIGTRNSPLALWQAEFVLWLLKDTWPDDQFEIVGMTTSGDDKSIKLSEMGGKGLYVKELEKALIDRQVDVCVHCVKDMPVGLAEGCSLAAIVERGEVRDVFLSRNKQPLSTFKSSMKIGTSSLRRKAQLKAMGIAAQLVDIRGNVDTRIKKLQEGQYDGIVLAGAGLLRLGHENLITEYFDAQTMIPAPGQGAIALECRDDDDELRLKLRRIHHDLSGQAITAERAFLKEMGANCALPLGAFCQIEQFQMRMWAFLSDPEAQTVLMESTVGPVGHSEDLGKKLADRFMSHGAKKILSQMAS
jgi:hydroxymethylbilane synthase